MFFGLFRFSSSPIFDAPSSSHLYLLSAIQSDCFYPVSGHKPLILDAIAGCDVEVIQSHVWGELQTPDSTSSITSQNKSSRLISWTPGSGLLYKVSTLLGICDAYDIHAWRERAEALMFVQLNHLKHHP